MKNYARIDRSLVAELLSTDGDITEMFHTDLIWVEVSDGESPQVGWGYVDQEFVAPAMPTEEQVLVAARAEQESLMERATLQMAPLQDAVDLEEATPEEEARLKAWKQYRVKLNRVDQQDGWPANIDWPTAPVD